VELQQAEGTFRQRGANLAAVAVASASALESWCQAGGITYPMLADPDHQVAEAYAVYNLLDDGAATPAVFIIDAERRITWQHVGSTANDYPSVETILAHLPSTPE